MTGLPILLKPYILGCWNDLKREYSQRIWNRTTFAALFIIFILTGMYLIGFSFFLKFKEHEIFTPELLENFIALSLFGVFMIICFSSIISSMGALFSSKDISIFFFAPVPLEKIFFAKFLHILLLSSWMFALVTFAFGIGLIDAFNLPITILPAWTLSFLLFLSIPTSIGIVAVICIANIVPAERLREVIVLIVILGLIFVLGYEQDTTLNSNVSNSVSKAIILSKKFSATNHDWLPHTIFSKIIASLMNPPAGSTKTYNLLFLKTFLSLLGYAVAAFSLALLTFRCFFLRGWAKSSNSNVQRVVYKSQLSTRFGNFLFRYPSPLRAFMGKELRTFIRDTTQSIQLLLLLTLTFIYIYNFRVIQSGAIIEDQYREIWQTILSVSNILFGGFVIAAVCTRFVFPTISLEGDSYQILRAAPVSLNEFIRYKFLTWFFPMSVLSFILFISGALAIEGSTEIIIASSVQAVCLSASLVALGIGTGAIYSRFDWENPVQVSSNFGSLVYMFLAVGVIICNLIPAGILYVFFTISYFQNNLLFVDMSFLFVCCLFLIVVMNGSIIRKSLASAENHLAVHEKC
jgi:ABC-2 type transport system permease protein